MKEYYAEMIYKFWKYKENDYNWEIVEDPDGLDQIEIRYCEKDKIVSRISLPFEILNEFTKMMLDIRNKMQRDRALKDV